MRTRLHFGGNTGDTGDRSANTRAAASPLAFLKVGTLGTSKTVRQTGRLVPTVPTDVLSGGNNFRVIRTDMSPPFPLFTVKATNGEKS